MLQWAGQLGDGRAISLGEAVGPDGTTYELQLKVWHISNKGIFPNSALLQSLRRHLLYMLAGCILPSAAAVVTNLIQMSDIDCV